MGLTRYEQETIITFNEAEPTATIYTFSARLKSRLAKLSETHPEKVSLVETLPKYDAKTYTVPKEWIKVNPSRNISEEARQKMARNLRKNCL